MCSFKRPDSANFCLQTPHINGRSPTLSSGSCFITGKLTCIASAEPCPLTRSAVRAPPASLVSETISMNSRREDSPATWTCRLLDSVASLVTELVDIIQSQTGSFDIIRTGATKSKHTDLQYWHTTLLYGVWTIYCVRNKLSQLESSHIFKSFNRPTNKTQ